MRTVLLHGLGQRPEGWREVVGLTRSPVECPALFPPDRHGVSYERLLADIEERYANVSEPIQLCGLSLGAVLALDFAIHHPDRVAGLVLIAGQFRSPTLLVDLQNLIFHCLPGRAFQDIGLPKQDAIGLARSMRRLDLRPGLGRVVCPTAVVCGARDRANLHSAKALASLLPQGKLYILPGVGHEANRDAPEMIAALLEQ